MKQLDWKSFAIGVLLTTTVVLSTGAATSKTEKWDENKHWEIKFTGTGVNFVHPGRGWEPVHAHSTSDVLRPGKLETITLWRRVRPF